MTRIPFKSMIAADFESEEHLANAIMALNELIDFLQEHRRQLAEELSRHTRVSEAEKLSFDKPIEDLGDM